MAIYGYIENGILHTKKIEGVMIPSGYKPVEDFDFSKTQTEDGYIIEVVPCDVGDKIVRNKHHRGFMNHKCNKCQYQKAEQFALLDILIAKQNDNSRCNRLAMSGYRIERIKQRGINHKTQARHRGVFINPYCQRRGKQNRDKE